MKDRQEHGTQGTVLVLGGDADVIKINNCNRNLFRRNSVDLMTEVKVSTTPCCPNLFRCGTAFGAFPLVARDVKVLSRVLCGVGLCAHARRWFGGLCDLGLSANPVYPDQRDWFRPIT